MNTTDPRSGIQAHADPKKISEVDCHYHFKRLLHSSRSGLFQKLAPVNVTVAVDRAQDFKIMLFMEYPGYKEYRCFQRHSSEKWNNRVNVRFVVGGGTSWRLIAKEKEPEGWLGRELCGYSKVGVDFFMLDWRKYA
jgi:hypothetical protein